MSQGYQNAGGSSGSSGGYQQHSPVDSSSDTYQLQALTSGRWNNGSPDSDDEFDGTSDTTPLFDGDVSPHQQGRAMANAGVGGMGVGVGGGGGGGGGGSGGIGGGYQSGSGGGVYQGGGGGGGGIDSDIHYRGGGMSMGGMGLGGGASAYQQQHQSLYAQSVAAVLDVPGGIASAVTAISAEFGQGGGMGGGKGDDRRGEYKKKDNGPSSHDYEPEESHVWNLNEKRLRIKDKATFGMSSGKSRAAKRWVLTFVIGVCTGLLAIFITYCTKALTSLKLSVVSDLMADEALGKSSSGLSFFFLASFNLFYVMIANTMVYLEPVSAGSGIPEIKCFLNGIALPRVVRVKTLMCKALGVLFAVSGGLPVGKEGPMVHSGSVIAAGISQGKSSTLGFDTAFSKFSDFRNDREKRDFVACGAAAGVAAAFGAPIGGVLFSLEEGASFWSTKLTWRAFFCAMMTVYTLYVIRTTETWFGQPDETSMFSFGEFYSLDADKVNYSVWELFLFILLGAAGGLIGAIFNFLNEKLTIWRRGNLISQRSRTAEALLVALAMSCLSYGAPLMWNQCTPRPVENLDSPWSSQERELIEELVSFQCPASEYNEVASLYMTDSDTAIKQLFHFREDGAKDQQTFSSSALFIFWFPYLSMACLTYGLAVPSGLFVPSLLSGAALGRLVGHTLHKIDGASGTFADSGTYALVGAAAGLGGMARMTISLAVILLEATGDMQYVLPLMLSLMAARYAGNMFNDGLYDVHIKLKRIPFLDAELPSTVQHAEIKAMHVMSIECITLPPIEKVSVIQDMLLRCEHDCFPVTDPSHGHILVGTILRKTLCVLLQEKCFAPSESDDADVKSSKSSGKGKKTVVEVDDSYGGYQSQPHEARSRAPKPQGRGVSWTRLGATYPRFPKIRDCDITPSDRECWLDLRPYINSGPHVVHENTSLQRTYRLFRTMGLRHLCVVDLHNKITGIITRKDLTAELLEERAMELWQAQGGEDGERTLRM